MRTKIIAKGVQIHFDLAKLISKWSSISCAKTQKNKTHEKQIE